MRFCSTVLVALLFANSAHAQATQPAPAAQRQAPPGQALTLSVADVIRRALDHNLNVLTATDSVERQRGARWLALSELLPNVHGSITESRQVRNLEAFGFQIGRAHV